MNALLLAQPGDAEWIAPLFDERLFWKFNTIWWRYWQQRGQCEFWVVIRPYAFAHFAVRRDGWRVLHEIAVDPNCRRRGYGRQLVEAIGLPMTLKTDADNVTARAFYEQLGFHCAGEMIARSGKRLAVYEKS